jgi:hypothetical protein
VRINADGNGGCERAFSMALIVGIVAVVLMVLPLSPRDAGITACFLFFVGLLNAGPDPIS